MSGRASAAARLFVVKVLVVGNGHVGKTTFVRRFCRGKFDDNYKKTIGCEFMEKRGFRLKNTEGKPRVDLLVWDTAGQDRYRAVTTAY